MLESVVIPDGVTFIGYAAFDNCSSLASVTLPDSINVITNNAFAGTAILKNQTDKVKYIGNWLIEADKDITSVEIKEGTVGIADCAISGCGSLKSITIPDSVTIMGNAACSDCGSLTEIIIGENNTAYKAVDGVIFDKSGEILVAVPAGKTGDYVIPDGVTTLLNGSFEGCYSLTSITIPDSVTSIGNWTFSGCSSITSITIPSGVTSIGEWTFNYCKALTSVDIPDSVTSIGRCAFIDCTSLKSVTIPESVNSIADRAFGYYTNEEDDECKVEDFKIFCGSETVGEQYAINNEIEYQTICETHTFGDWKVTKAATCTENGEQTRTCSVCGVKETEEIPATGHKFGEWEVTKEATCNATGTKERVCSVCGEKETEVIPKAAHNYTSKVVKPTYFAKGYTLYTCSVCGKSYKSNYTAALKLAKVTGVKLAARTANTVKLSWAKVTGATGYKVEVYNTTSKKWVTKATVTTNTATVKNLSASKTYKFRVRAYATKGKTTVYGTYSATYSAKTTPSAVKNFKVASRSTSSIKLSWSKNTTADGYILEQYKSGEWKRIKKVSASTTSLTVKSLKAGTKYKFRVKAYKMDGKNGVCSVYTTLTNAATYPAKVTGLKTTAKSKSAVVLKWNKVSGASGYAVQQLKNGKWVTVKTLTTNTYKVSKLTKNTTYKFRVKAYVKGDKTVYGSASTTLTTKTTK